jgi:catechol 2,3-dioxygenase-like lactoylglutathione lyase family enzyme
MSTTPEIDTDIYPMPMFVSFAVRDLVASTHWYEAAGFVVLATLPPSGPPAVVHLRRMRNQDILLVPGEPEPGSVVSFSAGADDLDARAETLRAAGGGTVSGPADTPWYTSDLTITDPDGHRIVLTSPRLAEMAANQEWTDGVRQSFGRRPEDVGPRG